MTKYFAMIKGECKGPFTLAQFSDAGIFPDTYVWCKGMSDWEKSADVAEIREYYRIKLGMAGAPKVRALNNPDDVLPRSGDNVGVQEARKITEGNNVENIESGFFPRFRGQSFDEKAMKDFFERLPDNYMDSPPKDMVVPGIVALIFLFPPTGIIALVQALRSRNMWKQSRATTEAGEKKKLCRESYGLSLSSRMWVGISFFLGIIVYSTLLMFLY